MNLERTDRNTDRADWLSTAEVGTLLGVTATYAGRLAKRVALRTSLRGGRRWVLRGDVESLIEREQQWISAQTACELTGFGRATVYRAAWAGLIEQRPGASAKRSMSRDSVLAWAETRRANEQERRRQLQAEQEKPNPLLEPDADHEWLSTLDAATRLGVSESRIKTMARDDKMPAVKKGGRWWFRADHLEMFAAARKALAVRLST